MTNSAPAPFDTERALHHLRVFLSVAETKSIAKAAEVIYKAQSAVARSIVELERSLGVPLFERRPRGMMPNAYGEAVERRALRIREEVARATEEFCRSARQPSASVAHSVANLMFCGRKLQLLIRLADLRNLSSAAAQMGTSQAGASMSLSRIESSIGQTLFQRMMQGMVATDPAARLVVRAKRIFAELRHMASDISALSGSLAGTVTIGTLPLGRTYVVPTAIAAALVRHPGLRVVTVESPYEQLIGSLRNGDIDVVFGALRPREVCQGLLTEPLFDDRMSIVARANHPLARRRNIEVGALLSERWILPRPEAPGRRLVEAYFNELGVVPPSPSVETGDLAILRQLLNCTDMLTAISPRQLLFEIRAGILKELPVVLRRTTRQIGLTVRDGALFSPAAQAVIEDIRRQARSLDAVSRL